ncbi:MAG TPA: DUF4242 domain-containing protein [Solirubrobacteraceae bacterium]|jgi:hypothetical protein
MQLFMIRRRSGWGSPAELEAAAKRSTEVADESYPDDIRWIRSYVVDEGDGTLGTFCVYEASSAEKIREHAGDVGTPADDITPIADTVVIRPDPVAA